MAEEETKEKNEKHVRINKRKLNLKKYGISKYRYNELYAFCRQYPEWKQKLDDLESNIRGIEYTGMPVYHSNADTTKNIAIKRAELSDKVDLIDNIAQEASPDLADYLIKNICYEMSYNYLTTVGGLACSQSAFFDHRRYFFWLLDKKKK